MCMKICFFTEKLFCIKYEKSDSILRKKTLEKFNETYKYR